MLHLKIYIYIFSFAFLTFKPDGRHHDHNAIIFSSPLLGQMYKFITDVAPEAHPLKEDFSALCKNAPSHPLLLSSAPLTFSPKICIHSCHLPNFFFFFHPTRGNTVLSFPQGDSVQWVCTVFPK